MVTSAVAPVAMAVASPHGAATHEDPAREEPTREVAVAPLKLPTAALTAVLGLLLVRGQFFRA